MEQIHALARGGLNEIAPAEIGPVEAHSQTMTFSDSRRGVEEGDIFLNTETEPCRQHQDNPQTEWNSSISSFFDDHSLREPFPDPPLRQFLFDHHSLWQLLSVKLSLTIVLIISLWSPLASHLSVHPTLISSYGLSFSNHWSLNISLWSPLANHFLLTTSGRLSFSVHHSLTISCWSPLADYLSPNITLWSSLVDHLVLTISWSSFLFDNISPIISRYLLLMIFLWPFSSNCLAHH